MQRQRLIRKGYQTYSRSNGTDRCTELAKRLNGPLPPTAVGTDTPDDPARLEAAADPALSQLASRLLIGSTRAPLYRALETPQIASRIRALSEPLETSSFKCRPLVLATLA